MAEMDGLNSFRGAGKLQGWTEGIGDPWSVRNVVN